jgi:beta-glucosidase
MDLAGGRGAVARRGRRLLAWLCVAVCPALITAGPAGAAGRCGHHPWCDTSLSPDERAGLLVQALTLDEKISLLAGGDASVHTGSTNPVPRLDLPPTYVTDGPVGVRQGSSAATALPAPMAAAAAFDEGLARLDGETIGDEAKDKGNDGVLAPTVNVMRTPLNGRSFEAYGEDPFLVSRTTVGWIEGAQSQGVFATVKHFAANNQEGYDPSGQGGSGNVPLGGGTVGTRYVENSIVDERTLREVYLPQFEAAVKEAHTGAVMCSYNRLNSQYACANRHLLTDILREDWGFKGLLMSDWFLATHKQDTASNLNNGLDLEMPSPDSYDPNSVKAALATGQSTEAEVNNHVRNLLRTMFAFGLFDRAAYPNDESRIDKGAHARSAQKVEESAITLLRNQGGALPLDAGKLKSIAVIGPGADTNVVGGGSANVTPYSSVTPLQGIKSRAGSGVQVNYDDGSDAARAADVAKGSNVALVFVADYEIEGADRQCLSLECPDKYGDQDGLIRSVAASQPNTIVVLQTGAPVLTPWRDSVRGLLEAWYPGGQGGSAIARVLFGDVNPSGHLPATFPAHDSDIPTAGDSEKYPGAGENVFYKEGLLVGYRWYDAHGIQPAYPFGAGLSYTTFSYRDLETSDPDTNGTVTASFTVKNTGTRAGDAVPQLYLGAPSGSPLGEPPKWLAGFHRVTLRPGRSARVSIPIRQRSRQYYSPQVGWKDLPGCMPVLIGSSSRDVALRGTTCASGPRCLSRRSRIGPRSIGRVRLRRTHKQLRRVPGLVRKTRRSYRYCVKGGRGVVSAVFSKPRSGRSLLVTTTAPAHGNRGVAAGRRSSRLRRAYPRRRRLGRGLYRAGPHSARLIGIRRGKVRFIAVADRRLIGRRKTLRRYLRLAGVTPKARRHKRRH